MFKNTWKRTKNFFKAPQLTDIDMTVKHSKQSYVQQRGEDIDWDKENELTINREALFIQHEALQKSLIIQHRTMIIALIAVIISIMIGIFAIVSKPDVKIEVHEQKAVQKTN